MGEGMCLSILIFDFSIIDLCSYWILSMCQDKASEASQATQEKAGEAKEQSKGMAQSAHDKVSESTQAAQQKASEATQAAQEKATQAKEQTGSLLQQVSFLLH